MHKTVAIVLIALAASGCGVLADSTVQGGRTDLSREVTTQPPRRIIRVRPPGVPMQQPQEIKP